MNVLDEGVRECLGIEIDTSLPGERVVRTLDVIKSWRGVPDAIRCDNGPELLSQPFVTWCEQNGVEILYIQPGKPNQNAYIERFNKTFRDELLSAYLFDDLDQVRSWLGTGCSTTTRSDRTTALARYRRRSSGRDGKPKTLTSNCPLDGEAYGSPWVTVYEPQPESPPGPLTRAVFLIEPGSSQGPRDIQEPA
jgi:hypothetical protein